MEASYFLLLAVRFCCLFTPGYIHPDEFFQSPEITGAKILGFKTFTAWEWQGPSPCRSPAPVIVTSGFMYYALLLISEVSIKLLGVDMDSFLFSGHALFFAPRIGMFIGTLFLDHAVRVISRKIDVDASAAILTLGTSWPYLIMQTRPFSNGIESFLLVASLYILCQASTSRSFLWQRRAVRFLGAILALGVFSRFTFVFYFAPVVVYLFGDVLHFTGRASIGGRLHAILDVGWLLATSFIAVSSFLVFVDSLFFGMVFPTVNGSPASLHSALDQILSHGGRGLGVGGNLTFTPLNSFAYNIDPKNLSAHGLHPRWLHAMANFPMMLGPIAFIAYFKGLPIIAGFLGTHKKDRERRIHRLRATMLGCAFTGMVLLSIAPHQEPRFLLPMVVPLAVVFGRYTMGIRANKYLRALWIVFNLSLFLFWGVLHQGALIPATLSASADIPSPNRESAKCVGPLIDHRLAEMENKLKCEHERTDVVEVLPPRNCAHLLPQLRVLHVFHYVYLETHMAPTLPLKMTEEVEFTTSGWRYVTFTESKFNDDYKMTIAALRKSTAQAAKGVSETVGWEPQVFESIRVIHPYSKEFADGSFVMPPAGLPSPFDVPITLENEAAVCPMIATENLPQSFSDIDRMCLFIHSYTGQMDHVRIMKNE